MTKRILLGMLMLSSNTVLEPATQAMLSGLPEASAHFARFKVTEIALSPAAPAQFDDTPILQAAELPAHARLDVIAWNGTSSGRLGFEADQPTPRAHPRGDRHPGNHLHAGPERDPATHGAADPGPGHALHQRRAGSDRRQLRRPRLPLPWVWGSTELKTYVSLALSMIAGQLHNS